MTKEQIAELMRAAIIFIVVANQLLVILDYGGVVIPLEVVQELLADWM